MTVILLTKAEAKAIAKEFRRNKIGKSFSIKPYDDQVYRTTQTGKLLVHYSYQVTGPQLKFIQARARRPLGVKVKSLKYGTRRAFPEPARENQTTAYEEYIQQNFDDGGHQRVNNYIVTSLRRANGVGEKALDSAFKELKLAVKRTEGYKGRSGTIFDPKKTTGAFSNPSTRPPKL